MTVKELRFLLNVLKSRNEEEHGYNLSEKQSAGDQKIQITADIHN
jgi:hypothetical protein